MKYWKGDKITSMTGDNIFVFGSNPEGRHGMGAAKSAMAFGAKYGKGRGLSGNTYALVTKNLKAGFYEKASGIRYMESGNKSVTKAQLSDNIKELYETANANPDLKFFITYQATSRNLNGYSAKEMYQLFTSYQVPENIRMHNSFRDRSTYK